MPESRTPPTPVQLIRAAELVALPWKNGGGITRQLAVWPTDASAQDFIWRISVADVAAAGAFSRFDGIDRTIVLIRDNSMTLVDHGNGDNRHPLQPWKPHTFAGEAAISAELPFGPTQDFNLMLRRGLASGQVRVQQAACRLDPRPGCTILHCAAGSFRITGMPAADAASVLHTGDSLIWHRPPGADAAAEIASAPTAMPAGQGAALIIAHVTQTEQGGAPR